MVYTFSYNSKGSTKILHKLVRNYGYLFYILFVFYRLESNWTTDSQDVAKIKGLKLIPGIKFAFNSCSLEPSICNLKIC